MVLNPLPVEYVSLDSLTMQRNSVFHPVFSGNEAVMIYSTESPEGNILAMIEKVDSVSWTKPRFIDSELAIPGGQRQNHFRHP
jgi:hypothetical protein